MFSFSNVICLIFCVFFSIFVVFFFIRSYLVCGSGMWSYIYITSVCESAYMYTNMWLCYISGPTFVSLRLISRFMIMFGEHYILIEAYRCAHTQTHPYTLQSDCRMSVELHTWYTYIHIPRLYHGTFQFRVALHAVEYNLCYILLLLIYGTAVDFHFDRASIVIWLITLN